MVTGGYVAPDHDGSLPRVALAPHSRRSGPIAVNEKSTKLTGMTYNEAVTITGPAGNDTIDITVDDGDDLVALTIVDVHGQQVGLVLNAQELAQLLATASGALAVALANKG